VPRESLEFLRTTLFELYQIVESAALPRGLDYLRNALDGRQNWDLKVDMPIRSH
jgi:hypothetical protein